MSTTTEEIPGAAEIARRADLADRIVTSFMEPALRLPREEWHLRYRAINRAAGVIAGYCIASGGDPMVAQGLRNGVERLFADSSSAPDYAARVKLCEARTKRGAAVLEEMRL